MYLLLGCDCPLTLCAGTRLTKTVSSSSCETVSPSQIMELIRSTMCMCTFWLCPLLEKWGKKKKKRSSLQTSRADIWKKMWAQIRSFAWIFLAQKRIVSTEKSAICMAEDGVAFRLRALAGITHRGQCAYHWCHLDTSLITGPASVSLTLWLPPTQGKQFKTLLPVQSSNKNPYNHITVAVASSQTLHCRVQHLRLYTVTHCCQQVFQSYSSRERFKWSGKASDGLDCVATDATERQLRKKSLKKNVLEH